MTDARILVLGTHNKKKRQELELLLAPWGFQLLTLSDFDNSLDVEETGTTFAENAQLKATKQAQQLCHWVLGEDSGLSVRALEGAPGIYSARYSGPEATDEKNNKHLLDQLGYRCARHTLTASHAIQTRGDNLRSQRDGPESRTTVP